MKKILVLNSGSSSLKYQLFGVDGDKYEVIANGLADRIGIDNSFVTIKIRDGEKVTKNVDIPSHQEAIREVFALLLNGALSSMGELAGVGHRVVQGGSIFKKSTLVDDKVIEQIDELSTLAPLHNPAAVLGLKAVKALLPDIKQVVVFDTAFHQTMEPEAYLYPLPLEQYKKHQIRRYGAHGTSHYYVSREVAKLIGKEGKIIVCHIGNGASVAAVDGGRSIDTSMGFTPVDGLLMGTRCGEVDPGALTYIADKEHMTGNEVWGMINKQAGVLGITGLSSDMRDIENAAAEGNERAKLALDVYYYRVKKYVGAYAAAMGGLDLVVFTGGVGENDPALREYVCSGMEFLGLEFDADVNRGLRGKDTILTKPASRVKAALIATNEELVIATDTFDIVEKLR